MAAGGITIMLAADEIQSIIDNKVEAKRHEIIQFLQEMVRIPSVTHPPGGDEGPVQAFIAEKFMSLGLTLDVFTPTEVDGIEQHEGWWPGLDYTDRPNVIGVWKGKGDGNTLILNGHCDVVHEGPRELWNHDPFGGDIADGRVYGRGAVDMKGGIAAMTMAVQILQECGITCSGDVILESVVNEELGGYNGTLACILRGYNADAAIVTEPSDLKIQPGTKGGQVYKITVPGFGAHQSFWWEGVSALDKAIKIKKAIESFEQIRYRQTRNIELYDDPSLFPIPAMADSIYSFVSGHPAIIGVPAETTMELWVDVLPGEDLDEVTQAFEHHIMQEAAMDPFLKDHPPKIERVDMRPFYPTKIPVDHQIVEALKNSFTAVMCEEPKICGFEAVCDAMIFNKYSDIPAVVFGAGHLAAAHRPDEFMDIEQLIASVKVLALTIINFCGIEAINIEDK
jgi:acetylornithine deacetylase